MARAAKSTAIWRRPSITPQNHDLAEPEANISSDAIRNEIGQYLSRLWRYGLVLSHRRDVADDLVQATCVRALERAAQFAVGTRMDRWLFAILHSIWLNEIRAQHIRQGKGFVDVDELTGVENSEDPIWANEVMQRVNRLPEAQRNTLFLVYVEELSYREAAEVLGVPIGTIMSRLAAARLRLANDSVLQARSPQAKGEQS